MPGVVLDQDRTPSGHSFGHSPRTHIDPACAAFRAKSLACATSRVNISARMSGLASTRFLAARVAATTVSPGADSLRRSRPEAEPHERNNADLIQRVHNLPGWPQCSVADVGMVGGDSGPLRSHSVPSQPWIIPLSPQIVQRHSM